MHTACSIIIITKVTAVTTGISPRCHPRWKSISHQVLVILMIGIVFISFYRKGLALGLDDVQIFRLFTLNCLVLGGSLYYYQIFLCLAMKVTAAKHRVVAIKLGVVIGIYIAICVG